MREDKAGFDLTPDDEDHVLASIAEIERQDCISAEEQVERRRRVG